MDPLPNFLPINHNHITSMRIYGALLLAIFLVLIVVNTLSVHRQQRELAQQRQQEMRDKMHNRHNNKKNSKNNNNKYVQTHGDHSDEVFYGQQQKQDGADDGQQPRSFLDRFAHNHPEKNNYQATTDEKMTFGTSSSSSSSNNNNADADEEFLSNKKKHHHRKNKKKHRKEENDDDENGEDTTKTKTTTAPKSFWQRFKSWFYPPQNKTSNEATDSPTTATNTGSGSSQNENNNNIPQSGDYYNNNPIDEDLAGNPNQENNFYSGYSNKKRNNKNKNNNFGDVINDDDDALAYNNGNTNNNNNDEFSYQQQQQYNDDLKQQVEKLKAQQDDLRAQLDEQNIHRRRKGSNNNKKNKKRKDDEDEDDDDDNAVGKGKINIKINLNTNGNNNHQNEDDDEEDTHHNKRLGKNKLLSPREKRQQKYFNKKFGEGDLNENNYDRGAGGNQNLLDMEDQQVLDQANRLVDDEKREGGAENGGVQDNEDHFDEGDCPGYPSEDGLPFVPYQKLVDSGRIYEPKFAYVTYITSAEFALPAAVLMFSIANTGSQYARVICVSKEISEHDRALLGLFAQIIEIDKIPAPLYVENARYRDTFTKLRMWQLEMFTKALYIDTDVIIKKNIDILFDLEEWSVPMDAEEQRYSTGMMLLAPSYKTFAAMMYDLNTTTVSMELPDLLFLKEFFERRASSDGLKLDDVPALKTTTTAAAAPVVSKSSGEWKWQDGKWTYVVGSPNYGNYWGKKSAATSARGVINIIPRWFQVYHIEFGSQYHSYLTHRVQKLTINDPRIYGIHYPGNGKPWNDMAKKLRRFSKYMCHPEMPEARVRWRYQPEFIWYVYYSMMKRGLRRIEKSLVGSPIFETERGKTIILQDYVKEAERKRKEEEKYSNNNYNNNYYYNSYWNNNNNYNNKNNNADDNNNNDNIGGKTNNNNYYSNNNNQQQQQNNNNKYVLPQNFDGPRFTPSACLVWNLTARAPPGVVLFDDDDEEETTKSSIASFSSAASGSSNTETTSTTTAPEEEKTSATEKETSLAEKYAKMYEKYYRRSNGGASSTTTEKPVSKTSNIKNRYTWNWDTTTTTTTKIPKKLSSNDQQPQSFDDYILTSQARPIFDLSTLDPLVLSLPQRTDDEGQPWERHERYTWYVTWCTKSIFKAPSDSLGCGESSFVSQFSDSVCRANFFEKFSIHRFGSVLNLLRNYSYLTVNATVTNTTTATSTTTTVGSASGAFASVTGGSSNSNNNNIESTTTTSTPQKEQQDLQEIFELVPEYPRDVEKGIDGVVIRSSVTLDNPKRTKFVDVVIRCDWSMDSESAADFDLDHPSFNTSKKYFAVVLDTVRKPYDRRYRMYLKSRCACSGGCGLAKLWNETYYTEDPSEKPALDENFVLKENGKPLYGRMRSVARFEWARNITGLEPTVDELFPIITILNETTENSSSVTNFTTTAQIIGSNSVASSSSSSGAGENGGEEDVDDGGAKQNEDDEDDDDEKDEDGNKKKKKKKNQKKHKNKKQKKNEENKKKSNKKKNKKEALLTTETETSNVAEGENFDNTAFTTTTTTTVPPPPRTTKPFNNQTEEEKLHVREVYEKANQKALLILNRNSSLFGCGSGSRELGKVLRAEESSSSQRSLLTSIRNQKLEKHFCELASGNSLFGRCEFQEANLTIQVMKKEFNVRKTACLPRHEQPWILVSSKSSRKMCNCTHVGGDAETQYTLEQCFEKAAKAGANVVNYGAFPQTEVSSGGDGSEEQQQQSFVAKSSSSSLVEDLVLKSKIYKKLVESEKNFTSARDILRVAANHLNNVASGLQTFHNSELMKKVEDFFLKNDEEYQNLVKKLKQQKRKNTNLKNQTSHEDTDDVNENENEKQLSHAERAKLARKRRQEAAKRAKIVTLPPKSTTTVGGYNNNWNNANDNNNNYNYNKKSNLLSSTTTSSLTGKACYFKKCSTLQILQENTIPMKDTDEKSGDYYVFVKNVFYVNGTGSHSLVL